MMNPVIQVQMLNADGSLNTTFNSPVTLTIANNPSSGVLNGTLTVTAVNGVATFSGLWINQLGAGYTLSATTAAFGTVVSNSFNISAGPPTAFLFSAPGSVLLHGCSGALNVGLQDQFGNPTLAVTPVVATPTGGTSPTYYSDPTCTTPVANQTIVANAANVNFYFKDGTSEIASLAVNGGGFPAANSTMAVQTQIAVVETPAGVQSSNTRWRSHVKHEPRSGFGPDHRNLYRGGVSL